MNTLNVFPIAGLYNELYLPKHYDAYKNCDKVKVEDLLSNINTIFWQELFSYDSLSQLVKEIEIGCSGTQKMGTYEKVILANTELFINLSIQSIIKVVNQNSTVREFFKWVEIISIACKMFSKYRFSPYELTIQDGFLTPDFSSKALINNALTHNNPLYQFLDKKIFPYLNGLETNLIWINGAPKISSIAIAMYMKQFNPGLFVGIRNHSSEYYSMNKIIGLLQNNKEFFKIIDCVILDDNKLTSLKVEDAVSRGVVLNDIHNIIFKDKERDKIVVTQTRKINRDFKDGIVIRNVSFEEPESTTAKKLANLRLNPNTQCFWKRCTFCGINEKYNYITEIENQTLSEKLDIIQKILDKGVHYLWFEDEAIHPDFLNKFCDEVISRKMKFLWQARARFHIGFTEELCDKLYLAGLREIRFGLESANTRILCLMNKFESNITLKDVENIVKNFTKAGIHVHFPMIVGYPSETNMERKETYDYLNYLKDKYKYFSYNINILMLDVSSRLYKNFANFNIASIRYPCPPSEYLGNVVDFDSINESYSYKHIDLERQNVMAKYLYPWLPITALTKSHILYRLSETIRNTLIWSIKEREEVIDKNTKDNNVKYKWNENIVGLRENEEVILYNWDTHSIIKCSQIDFDNYFNRRFLYDDLIMTEEGKNLIEWGVFIKDV